MQENNPALLCGNVLHQQCPSREILNHLTGRWAVLVFVCLYQETHRFSQLKHRITGISEKMLSQTLRELESDGFVHREVFPEVPPRVEYSLTPLGREAAVRLLELVHWIEHSLPTIRQVQGKGV